MKKVCRAPDFFFMIWDNNYKEDAKSGCFGGFFWGGGSFKQWSE